ncbi:DUF3037 domain-containing protein [Aurantiacibacter suaedae]|uniref:DUF3037 domain-containing protein n=1 Tax=Aurantiacibacter suaedae TaxID=2545755 RepID=UPI0010F57172|nr:DUF3037 domain-containing protein [Aurantiacibacter suaedae]
MYDGIGSDFKVSRRPYSYSVLRYVHDVVTGEFVNVGLVFFAPAARGEKPVVLFEFKERIQRLRPLFPDIDRKSFVTAIAAVRRNAVKVARNAEKEGFFSSTDARSLATQMLPHDGSSLQWSKAGTGIAKDTAREFHRIANRMLSAYDKRNENRRSDEDVWRPVRQALHDRDVEIDLEPKTIAGSVDTIEFQHTWVNGQIHAYEPLSFDLADAGNIRDKARRWRGNLDAAADGVACRFKAYFIAGKPSDSNLIDAYHSALEILRQAETSPEVYEESEIDLLVSEIEQAVGLHRSQQRAR